MKVAILSRTDTYIYASNQPHRFFEKKGVSAYGLGDEGGRRRWRHLICLLIMGLNYSPRKDRAMGYLRSVGKGNMDRTGLSCGGRWWWRR